MKIFLVKSELGWRGDSARDQEQWDELKNGTYSVEIKKPRNLQFHRKYFALLNTVFEMQDIYLDFYDFFADMKIKIGLYEVKAMYVEDIGEVFLHVPKSISFAKMDDTAFERVYSKTIDKAIEFYCPGTTYEEMDKAAKRYLEFV
jgi:hypothetical protein